MLFGAVGMTRAIVSIIAIAFGLLTLLAGGRVLLGADPGYVVYLPLLIFNTVMGLFYVAAGLLAWRTLRGGRNLAALVFLANLTVLFGLFVLQASSGEAIAAQSLRAMSLRTVVWLALFIALWWPVRKADGVH